MNHKKINKTILFFVIFVLVLGLPSFISLIPSIYYGEAQKTNAHYVLDDSDYFYENVHSFLVKQTALSEEFTDEETSHMKDVRFLFNLFRGLSIIFVLLIIIYFIYLKTKKEKGKRKKTNNEELFLAKTIKKASIISFLIILLLVFFVVVNFNFSFDVFHRIFFPQGNWVFPRDSLLITLFPQTFFFNIAKKIMVLSISSIIIIGSVSFLIYEKEKKKKLIKKIYKK